MKPITLFYLEKCPFCKKAFRFIEELQTEYPELKTVEIQTIEESRQPDTWDLQDPRHFGEPEWGSSRYGRTSR